VYFIGYFRGVYRRHGYGLLNGGFAGGRTGRGDGRMSGNFTDGRLRYYENLMRQKPRSGGREDALADLRCKYCIRAERKKCGECPYIKIIFDAMERGGVQNYSNRYGAFALEGRAVVPHEDKGKVEKDEN
jgi:hypothetical protein